ncbi:hypothetical protein AMTR_s00019p00140850 [Amborella trichopoda]|uniref:WAT1-related protein n=1 Tax=Amborella trichopoda TaxID=13333 RepID=W1PGS9_AMBTC|nr:hypothetical protein AMTR_s00019p00140850 [Amborella trichopoda]
MVLMERHKPAMTMAFMQFAYAGMTLITRAALTHGMSAPVFIVYRQAIATLCLAPFAWVSKRRYGVSLGFKSFCQIFMAALIGVTINQNCYFQGLYYSSSATASATSNLIPAITFAMAASIGLEKVNIGSPRGQAKVLGTLCCVGGAMIMAFYKGPLLSDALRLDFKAQTLPGGENWTMGCLFLFGSSICWSLWLNLQVSMARNYPDPISQSAWMCLFATFQSAILTLLVSGPDPNVWKLRLDFELLSCFYSGIVGSGLSFLIQAWCISERGPVYTAMFNPLCTVIVTIMACLFLHEQLYLGSMGGAILVVCGLYAVLWGKSKDLDSNKEERLRSERLNTRISGELEEPLLDKTSHNPKVAEV